MIMQRIFPRLLLTHPTVVIGVKFVSTFVDWGDQSLVPNIGEDARVKDDVSFSIANRNLSVYFIQDTINITCLFGLKGLYFVL